jgi:hypothetical protein
MIADFLRNRYRNAASDTEKARFCTNFILLENCAYYRIVWILNWSRNWNGAENGTETFPKSEPESQ